MHERPNRSARRGRRARLAAAILSLSLAPLGCSVVSLTDSLHKDLTTLRSSQNPTERYEAYTDLGNPYLYRSDPTKRAEAVRILALALQSEEDPMTRVTIARSLARLGGPAARAALVRALPDSSAMVRTEVCSGLGSIGSTADVPSLVNLLRNDPDLNVRLTAAAALGHFSDQRAAEVLVDALKHPDPAMRYEALHALRQMTETDRGADPAAWEKYLQTARFDGSVKHEKVLGVSLTGSPPNVVSLLGGTL